MLIRVSNLSASYGNITVLDNISLDIHSNQSICILGDNSAGKSTFLKCLCKLKKYKGTITYKENLKIFYLPQENILIEELSVKDNLNLFLKDYDKENYNLITEEFKIKDILNTSIKNLSGGVKRKISLCIALIEKNDILILDEPFVALDTNSKEKFLAKFKELSKNNTTLIYTTHLKDTLSIANKIFYLKNYKLEEKQCENF